ncbi:MAG: class I SAM-dependent methyltransferase [Candidatus Eisenbacteria sp.]|nr:class I SAM-dependent methyltransferase [Candidatus Eisenbacteria bacterium]
MPDPGRSGVCTGRQDWENAWQSIPLQSRWTHTDETFLNLLRRFSGDNRPRRFLEAGSGAGHISHRLTGENQECYLVDYVRQALRRGRDDFQTTGIQGHFVEGDIRALPFRNRVFDLSWNAGVLQTVPAKNQRELLAEMKRVTKPGAWVAVIVPRTEGALYRRRRRRLEAGAQWPYGKYESPSSEILESFEFCGFSEIQVERFGPLDGLGEIRILGRVVSFMLTRTALGRSLEKIVQVIVPRGGYWVLMAGRVPGTGDLL